MWLGLVVDELVNDMWLGLGLGLDMVRKWDVRVTVRVTVSC